MKITKKMFIDKCTELADEHFPKGQCKERGKLLVFIAELIIWLSNSWEE